MEKKSLDAKTLIILLVTVLVVGGLGGYLVSTLSKVEENEGQKIEEKPNEDSKKNKPEEKPIDKKTESKPLSYAFDIEKTCGIAKNGTTCTKKVTLGEVEKELKIIAKANDADPNHFDYRELTIDGQTILSESYMKIGKIIIIDDILILDTYCTNCGGSSAGIPLTKVVNKTGKVIYTLTDINFEKDYDYDGYEVKDNEIIIRSSRVGFMDDYYPTYDCYFKNLDTGIKGIQDSNVVNGTNYDNFANTIAKIEYKVAYLGNEKFSVPLKSKEYKFGDLYTKAHCINEYNEYLKIKDMY